MVSEQCSCSEHHRECDTLDPGDTQSKSPCSSITTKTIYEALTVVDTHEQCLQGETVPAALSGYRKKKG